MVKEILDATEHAKKIPSPTSKTDIQKIDPVKGSDKLNAEGIKTEEKKDNPPEKKEEKPAEPKKEEKKPEEGTNTLQTLDAELERRGRTRATTKQSNLEEALEEVKANNAQKPQEQSEALAYNLAAQSGKPSNSYGTIYGTATQSNDAASVYSRASGQAGRESEDHGQFYARATRQNEGPESQYQQGLGGSPQDIRESIDPLAKLSAYARR